MYILLVLPIERVAFNLAFGNFKEKMDEINPLSKFVSPLISDIFGEDTTSVRGSFAVQSGDHFLSWDHLRSNLGIICGTKIICGPGSFAGLYRSNCGPIIPPGKDTFVDEIISLEYCKKDILGRMKQLQFSSSEVTTEAELILCGAGKTFFFSFQMCR